MRNYILKGNFSKLRKEFMLAKELHNFFPGKCTGDLPILTWFGLKSICREKGHGGKSGHTEMPLEWELYTCGMCIHFPSSVHVRRY